MCSSGSEALSCPFTAKRLRRTGLRFIISPAIATLMQLRHRASSSAKRFSIGCCKRWARNALFQAWDLALD